MMLDWPVTSYKNSFTHVSFARFSYLEEYYAHIKEYLGALGYAKTIFPALAEGAETILALFEEAEGARKAALETASDRDFERYTGLRDEGFRLTGELVAAAGEYLEGELEIYGGLPDYEALGQEAEYCLTLLEYLETELRGALDTRAYLKEALEGKFCVIGKGTPSSLFSALPWNWRITPCGPALRRF
jgi:adenylate cyclase